METHSMNIAVELEPQDDIEQKIEDAYKRDGGFEALMTEISATLKLLVSFKGRDDKKNKAYEQLIEGCVSYPYLEGALLHENESSTPDSTYKATIHTTGTHALNILADYQRVNKNNFEEITNDKEGVSKDVKEEKTLRFDNENPSSAQEVFAEWIQQRIDGLIPPPEEAKPQPPHLPGTTLG